MVFDILKMFNDLMEFILNHADKLGAQYAEVRLEHSVDNSFILKNGNPDAAGFSSITGLSIRVIVDGAMGFSSTNRLIKPRIKEIVGDVVKTARASSRLVKKPVGLSEEKTVNTRYEIKQKTRIQDIEPDEKLSELMAVENTLKDTGINLPARFFELSDEVREKYYVNSEGTRIHSIIPRVGIFYLITAMSNGNMEQRMFQYAESGGWEAVKNWNLPEKIASEAKTLDNVLREGKKSPEGKLDLVLGPEVVGIAVHESTGHPYESDRILGREAAQAGESFVSPDMLNTRIGSDVVNVVEDPTIRHSYGFYLYDDEGVKAKKRFLIKEGVINEFLCNRETAYELGIKSNAAARASNFDREPIVRMANTFISPGDYGFEELIGDVKHGVYMKTFMEWNIDDKRFNQRYVGREAYLIENGELKHPVKKPVLELTTPAFYEAIDAVGNDLAFVAGTCGKGDPMQGIPVWMGGPHIRLRDLTLK